MHALRTWTWLIALAWCGTAMAAEGRNVYLAQAKVFYQGLEFEKCLQRLEQAAKLPGNSRQEQAEVELYNGLCKFNLNKAGEAEAHFKAALELSPELTLPPATSPRITAAFDPLAARARRAQELAEPVPAPEPAEDFAASDAPRELSLAPPSPIAEGGVSAAVKPSGSKVLPIALAGTAVGATVLGAIFGSLAKSHQATASSRDTYYADALAAEKSAGQEATVANVAFAAAGTAAVGAVVTWFLSESGGE